MKNEKKRVGFTPEKASFKNYMRMFRGIKMPWFFIVMIFVCTIGVTVAALTVTYFTGDVVDAEGNVPTAELVSFTTGYFIIAICVAGELIFEGVASERINLGLRKKLWRKIIYVKQSSYDKDNGETLVSRVTTDCDYASKLLTTIVSFVSIALSLVMYVVQMYALNVTIANYIMLLIPVSILIGWGYAKLKFLIAQKTQAMLSRSTTYLVERTRNLSLIKTSNTQEMEIEAGKQNFQEQYIMQIKTGLMNSFYSCLQTLYNIVSIIIPFTIGAGLVANGVMSAGDVVVIYSIAGSVGIYFTNVIDSVGTIRQSNGALARVISTMDLPDELQDDGLTMDEPDADISLENVTFAYGTQPVLKHVTCQIPKHKVTAIIGTNGSGKTTLFKLLERLYAPQDGKVQFGEKDAEVYQLSSWRKAFGVVSQGSPLMEGTIRENICYGCERDVSDDELIHVAKKTGVYDFVSELPDGFDTKVAPGGQNFSGGQRQCIAIARAMMCSPDYLLLDEATSNLDAQSEKSVLAALDELMLGRTTVIIAHSLSTIRKADHVIVLHDGKVEASGSPAQILKQSDNYLSKVINRRRPETV